MGDSGTEYRTTFSGRDTELAGIPANLAAKSLAMRSRGSAASTTT
jgi:hypothetical protein